MGDAINGEEKQKSSSIENPKMCLQMKVLQKEQIDAKVKSLSEVSHKLAEAMYKKEQGGATGEQPKTKE